jgi:hypothetical protein
MFVSLTGEELYLYCEQISVQGTLHDPRYAACTYVSHRTHIDWNYHSRDILTANDILLMRSNGISGITDELHCIQNLFNFTGPTFF